MTSTPSAWASEWLDDAYRRLERTPHFVKRPQQLELSNQLAQALLSGTHILAEAPTGTGKTLAYLLGGLAAAATREHFLLPARPLAISTATIALQQQLLQFDLPWLAKAGLLNMTDVALVKGRGNFVCLRSAENLLEQAQLLEVNPEATFIDDEYDYPETGPLENLVADLQSGRWDGDLTRYSSRPRVPLRHIVVQSSTCVRNKCAHFRNCGYIAMRKAIPTAKVLLVNHDLLLANWAAWAKGLETSLGQTSMDIVFDEAHHLPHKAVAAGASTLAISRLGRTLPAALQSLEELLTHVPVLDKAAKDAACSVLWTGNLEDALQTAITACEAVVEQPGETLRLRGELPEGMAEGLMALQLELTEASGKLSTITTFASERQSDDGLDEETRRRCSEVTRRAVALVEQLVQGRQCLSAFVGTSLSVRWMNVADDESITLNASPIQARDVLNQWLWNAENMSTCAFVSATLRDAKGFGYFRAETGVPDSAKEMVLPSAFDYSRAVLTVAAMTASPKPTERAKFKEELKAGLLRHFDRKEGSLLVFTSWQLLKELSPWILQTFGEDHVLIQGDRPVSTLVAEHKRRIDAGSGNMLVGVATLAEGMDLPGAYCVHVGVVALPFAVPTTPLEQELNDRLGSRYFGERSLPAATLKLVQLAGRLIRRESDGGRITVYDHRLESTGYGRSMRKALPPFRYQVEPMSALQD